MTLTNTNRSVSEWERKTWHSKAENEGKGTNIFRTEILHRYEGTIEGEGSIQYLIAESEKHTAGFVALEKIVGSIDGHKGSFVFQQIGTFDNGKIKITLTVLPDLGTGQLSGLSGHAVIECDQHQEIYPMLFEYEIKESVS